MIGAVILPLSAPLPHCGGHHRRALDRLADPPIDPQDGRADGSRSSVLTGAATTAATALDKDLLELPWAFAPLRPAPSQWFELTKSGAKEVFKERLRELSADRNKWKGSQIQPAMRRLRLYPKAAYTGLAPGTHSILASPALHPPLSPSPPSLISTSPPSSNPSRHPVVPRQIGQNSLPRSANGSVDPKDEDLELLAEGKGKLSLTSSHLFELILSLDHIARDLNHAHKHSPGGASSKATTTKKPRPIVLLHPSQPFSHVSRLILASLAPSLPAISFRSTCPRGQEFQWSNSTDVSEFIRDAARAAKFSVCITHDYERDGDSKAKDKLDETVVDVEVPTFADRTRPSLASPPYLHADCFKQGHNKILTGINFIFYYGTTSFKRSGISDPFLITITTNIVNIFMTLPGMWGVERFGRHSLLLVGACAFANSSIAIVDVTISVENIAGQKVLIAFVCIYIAFFAYTWGPIAWVATVRAKAMSLSIASNWLWNFGIGYATPYLVNVEPGSAGPAKFCIPETKGLSLEQIDVLYTHTVPWKAGPHWAKLMAEDAATIERNGSSRNEDKGRECLMFLCFHTPFAVSLMFLRLSMTT
ncbi:hypothetical protein HGRIS_001307 [Hohenbuehelia grisea]|uniref:Uncharacterized protein n=1 Tax=Hohenbuehelia grisea TaxID=104357 RepID=A0ABR3JNY4_9AGAR